jgi:hypothetical protein
MEVKANINIDAAQRVVVNPVRSQRASAGADTASFQNVEALDQALQATPEVRPEAVAHAQELIGDVKYPPADTIRSISALLAIEGVGADGSSQPSA